MPQQSSRETGVIKNSPGRLNTGNQAVGSVNPNYGRRGVSRREAIRNGALGASGLLLSSHLDGWGRDAEQSARAKSVIQIWMWGGPSHLDTLDPKPDAGYDYCGPLSNPTETNVSGIRISELLPLLAKQADKYSILRSMTHGVNGHETASYMVQSGWRSGGRQVHPSVGSVVSLFKGYDAGYKGLIPPYIVVTQPQGRFSEAGFLGNRYKPFSTGGDPAKNPFVVEGVVARNITKQRQKERRKLLHNLNTLEHAMKGDPRLVAMGKCEKEAYDLILGDAGKVFELSQEKDSVRDRYGRSSFGQSCLLARRLVESEVPYVTINYRGWDTHKQNFQTMNRRLPDLDQGLSALLQDLSDRGLLDSTIVWWGGEFGRTPKIQWKAPWNGGRGHYGKVFSSMVAGGGFQGGHVVGSSNKTGEEVQSRPVYPVDLIRTMYDLLGIDTNATLPHPQGLTVPVTPTAEDNAPSGGRLKEIV